MRNSVARTGIAGLTGAVTLALVATTGGPAAGAPPTHTTAPDAGRAAQVHAEMDLDQRIGQMFMVATPADSVGSDFASVVSRQHVGNVILMGRSTRGANHTRFVTAGVQRLTEKEDVSGGVPMFVSADQEGGEVQVLRGPGYADMPTALRQGSWSTSTLTSRALSWGTQLSRAGVNQNLSPVLDTVPREWKSINDPIGRYDREFGAYSSIVTAKGGAFQRGMTRAGVATTSKHFPGLGRVRGNTDTTSGVTDSVTTTGSTIINPFASSVDAGTPFVMMSSASYTKIDASQPALFSPKIVTDLLRGQLGFDGVVITDDVGNAKQLQSWKPADRATRFVDAGGDMVLTARTDTLPEMVSAVRSKALSDPAFREKVDDASLRILEAKEDAGLLATRITPSGNWGYWTIKRLQHWLGKPETGTFDRTTIKALQYRVGTSTDGRWGPSSHRALQSYLGISQDGTTRWDTRTVRQLQRYLNTQL